MRAHHNLAPPQDHLSQQFAEVGAWPRLARPQARLGEGLTAQLQAFIQVYLKVFALTAVMGLETAGQKT